ncbi:hypothetical protein FJP62_17405 [Pantoea vagans]|uniref:Uncharacterized protein n=1 Tax=Pantoea anthophila TaxID=470931 RepID=A0ABY2Z7N7_9GAMM|nr:hypothetical protein FJP62_17405 [Pantoea vagans]TPV27619.1 hypothetical protein FJW00_09980 [Pantoea anthophila]
MCAITGAAISDIADKCRIFTHGERGNVLFVDEMHKA